MKTFAVAAPYGVGGLGRHLQELVELARADGTLARYYCRAAALRDPQGITVPSRLTRATLTWTPARFSVPWRTALSADLFDWETSRVLEPAETHVGFSLQALRAFGRALGAGTEELELVSPTSHIKAVQSQHEKAWLANPIERPWLNDFQVRKALAEYALADRIVVPGDYVRQSFLRAGFAADRLVTRPLSPDPRYQPVPRDDTPGFGVLYVGSLMVHKGVALLIDAFKKIVATDARLTLVGGWSSRQMREYMARSCFADPRIRVVPGDPLTQMSSTDVYVHPSYEDGWAYAVAEAIACGVPAVVSEDTGAGQLITADDIGRVVPTGDRDALVDTLTEYYRRGRRGPTRKQ